MTHKEQNARAAVPELLAALRLVIDEFHKPDAPIDSSPKGYALFVARQAIAKFKGEGS